MSNTPTTPSMQGSCNLSAKIQKKFVTASALLAMFAGSLVMQAKADTTMSISAPPFRIFAGAGVSNVYPGYTNALVTFTLTGDTNDIDLFVVGAPANVTAGFSTNPLPSGDISALVTVTNTVGLYLSAAVTNAAKGVYPITLVASNRFNGATVTRSTVLVLPNVFTAQIGSSDTNWSSAANWSLGTPPSAGDPVRFQYSGTPQINTYSDTSVTLESLAFLPRSNNLTVTNFLAPGVTLAINGANGFWAGADLNPVLGQDGLFNFFFIGLNSSLVVTNPQADFSMYSLNNTGGGNRSTQDLSQLGTLSVDVNRVGMGNGFLIYPNTSTAIAENGAYSFARTNIVRATYVGDYSGLGFMTNSIMFMNNNGNNNGNFASAVNLGISNLFLADSISAISHGSGNANSSLRFNPAFTNIPCKAVFRGTNGGRMSLFGVGIDSGLTSFTARTRGAGAYFIGGTVDMLVDTMWLGHNRTNFTGGNAVIGNLLFDRGIIDVNTLRSGFKQWTNNNAVQSTITVGGFPGANAVLSVNNLLELGFAEISSDTTATPTGFGRVVINTNGIVRANSIQIGAATSGNTITINNGGNLILTNTMGSPLKALTTLTIQGNGRLTLNVTAGVTSCYVTNLTDAANSKINIASLNGFSPTVPATNILIHYESATGAGAHQIGIGSLPAGYNNVLIVDNGVDKNIELRINTNAPATLVWKGYVNNVWDHSTPNWFNTANGSQVAFFDADTVIFAETNNPNFKTISIADAVIPAGITMSNSASAYIFEGSGSISGCPMTKVGTANFENNVSSGAVVQFDGGTLLGTGVIGGVTLATNTAMSYAGSVTAGLTVDSGAVATLLSGSSANGSVSVSGVLTNFGTIQGGSLAVNGSGLLHNGTSGWLRSIGSGGSGNVAAGATLINEGTIGDNGEIQTATANTLTINGTFKDTGVGNIYLTTLTVNGGATFLPGGDGVGTTFIRSSGVGSSFPGRLTMLAGSTTLIKVDLANPQTNTIVKSAYTDFGGNTSVRSFDGCTILMTNVNPGAGLFAAGQMFRVFQGVFNASLNPLSDIGDEGLNTTNRYPIVQPIVPAVNTKWDLTYLRDVGDADGVVPVPKVFVDGYINIVSFPTTGTNITFSSFSDGSSVVTHLQWPAEYIGWRLQQQTNPISVGLFTNWVNVTGSTTTNDLYITNDAAIDTSFFRMVYP
ncbi:MAG: hypothetical protein U1F65_05650 [Verrucomicrobiota bacterium]